MVQEYVHGVWRLIDSSDARHILVLVRVDGADEWVITHCTVKSGTSSIIPVVDLILPATNEERVVDLVEAYIDQVFDQQTVAMLGDVPAIKVKQYFEVKSGDAAVIAKKIEFIESFPFARVIGASHDPS